jgi:hypothetical protein
MNAKQSLMAALVGIATMIAMPLAAAAGDHYANYENTQWQASGAVIPAGHHYGWRNRANYNPGMVCDEDGDDCHPALQCDEDDDDCRPAVQCDADGDDCEPSAGYSGQYYAPPYNYRKYNNYGYNPGYGRPYDNSYDYNSGYGSPYNAPYDNNGAYGGLSALAPLLQQFVR